MDSPWKFLRGKGAVEILLLLRDKKKTFTGIQGALIVNYDMAIALDTLTTRLNDLSGASLIAKEKREYFLTEKGNHFVDCIEKL